jgi:hypothetical protein
VPAPAWIAGAAGATSLAVALAGLLRYLAARPAARRQVWPAAEPALARPPAA